jgi:hypothetical protein
VRGSGTLKGRMAQGLPWHGGQGRPAAACHGSAWPMGLGGPGGWAGAGRVGPSGSDRSSRIGFSFFSNLFLMRKQFQKNL